MALTQKQVANVCMLNQGNRQCRYLNDEINDKGDVVYICNKLSPDKAKIDQVLDEYLKSKGGKPLPSDAIGDNCSGYIPLWTKPQGYDVNS